MTPRQADPQVRAALIETAARLLAEGGPDHLTLRRLTDEVGTSTMAVYTHFGSMDDLRLEVAREGFHRLRQKLAAVEPTPDPVADLARLGSAYLANATQNPNLYQAIFGPRSFGSEHSAGYDTFELLVAAVERCMDAGRFSPADPVLLATQVWAAVHGTVALAHTGLLPAEELDQVASATTRNLFVGFGDERSRVEGSLASVGR